MVSTQDGSRRFYCLIEGESTIFGVDVEHDHEVGDLKKAIKYKRKDSSLKGIDHNLLDLWKVNVFLDALDDDSLTRLNVENLGNQVGGIEKLGRSYKLISQYWPQKPSKEHLHIFVKAPAASNPVGTSFLLADECAIGTSGIDAIDKEVHAELKSLQPVVEAFLRDPELSTWVPQDCATPSIREFITGLQIPTYRNGKPSLLFHGLDTCDGEEITRIFGTASTPMCIYNTSGSGKTRRIMEGLTKYWGFYFAAGPDANGIGIRDLRDALDLVASNQAWVSDLRGVSPERRAAQNDINGRIASRVFRRVLAARIVGFQFFLELAVQVDGHLQEKHKRIWLLFQLFESLDPRGGGRHPLIQIFKKLCHASDEVLYTLVYRLGKIIDTYLPHSRLILGLDDVQWANRLYPYSGISSLNAEVFRSIIRDMIQVFTTIPVKLVVSGTGLPMADLQDAMFFGVSGGVEVFHELGMFDTWPKLKTFLDRYVPASILETPSGYRLQQRMREYLLGRYRFSVSFLEYFLMNGLQSPHKLLNTYLEQYITCPPGDIGDPFTSGEPGLHINVQVNGFDWDRLKLDSNAIQEAAKIVQSHLIKGRSPAYGPVTANLVDYGIAHLREGHTGHIVEPLAFVSLMKWLQTQASPSNLLADMRLRAGDADSRGCAFEDAMILYLPRKLRYPVSLSSIFDFHPEHTPSWANEEAQIVARLNGADVYVGEAPQNPGLGVVHHAETIEDVIRWIETPDPAPAILIASNSFGPDVLSRVKLSSSNSTGAPRNIILMGRFKSYTDGNKESLDALMLSYALTSLHPNHWFKNSSPDQRQKLINTIGKHDVVRFVAGYPSRPNLKLNADSVTQAISLFDSSDALASISLDMLIQQFKSPSEALNVLGPMENALTRKRKASKMS